MRTKTPGPTTRRREAMHRGRACLWGLSLSISPIKIKSHAHVCTGNRYCCSDIYDVLQRCTAEAIRIQISNRNNITRFHREVSSDGSDSLWLHSNNSNAGPKIAAWVDNEHRDKRCRWYTRPSKEFRLTLCGRTRLRSMIARDLVRLRSFKDAPPSRADN